MPSPYLPRPAQNTELPALLKLLAHAQRWRLVQALAHSDRRVGELVRSLAQPQNLVSYHLRQLRGSRLVRERRSSADQRDVYYSLNLQELQWGLAAIAGNLHEGLVHEPGDAKLVEMLPAGTRVLVLCTHNSARSQMAEGLIRHLSGGKIEAHSAGTERTRVHPLAIAAMATLGIDISGHRSKHVDEFLGQDFDYVITVCDQASETCPVFPGAPERIHWSIADPSAVEGTEEQRLKAFQLAMIDLRTRIGFFLNGLARSSGPPPSLP
jgi:protein-tyrosine-phosphatase